MLRNIKKVCGSIARITDTACEATNTIANVIELVDFTAKLAVASTAEQVKNLKTEVSPEALMAVQNNALKEYLYS